MLSFIRKLFNRKDSSQRRFTDEEYDRHYELKKIGLEKVLGEMYHMVGHAIIPFAVGGAVDMYYFPHSPYSGTAFATMELIEPDGTGPKRSRIGTYELVSFTKHPISENDSGPHRAIERRTCGTFTTLANYASDATLKPFETCEVPHRDGTRFIVFDQLAEPPFTIGDNKHGLLVCIEVFESELNFARDNGTDELLELLRSKGHYPYSDLDREPVV